MLPRSKGRPHGPGAVHPRVGECHGAAALSAGVSEAAATDNKTATIEVGREDSSDCSEPVNELCGAGSESVSGVIRPFKYHLPFFAVVKGIISGTASAAT